MRSGATAVDVMFLPKNLGLVGFWDLRPNVDMLRIKVILEFECVLKPPRLI